MPGAVADLAAPFLVAALVACAATLVAERVGPRLGLTVAPRADRWHRRPTPLLGGAAIMLGVLAAVAAGGLAGSRFRVLLLLALAMGGVGLVDDARSLRPQAKLVAQVVLAGILIELGFLLRLTGYPLLDLFLTVFWIVGITNAFNLLDNMDGLAASMAVIAGSFRLAFFLLDGDPAGARAAAAFIGAVAGFLVRNLPPARIFMGDAGSLFLGFFLAGLCLVGEAPYSRGIGAVLVLPVLLLLIPIFDTTFVTVTRLLTGRPVAEGGRDHTSHRLVSLGIGERGALAFLCAISVASGLVAVASYRYGLTYTVALLALLVVGMVLLGVYLAGVQSVPARAGGNGRGAALLGVVTDFPYKRHVATVGLDVVLVVIAYYAAYLLRFEGGFRAEVGTFLRTVGPLIACQVSALAAFGAYRGLWRYTGLPDLLRLLRGITAGSAASVLFFVFATRFAGLSRAVFVLDWLLLVVLVGGSRVSFRLLGELLRRPGADFRRVLIYGAGDGGELTLRELRNNAALGREPVGFLDDDRAKAGTRIHDLPVLGGLDGLEALLEGHPVSEVVVASRKIRPDNLRRLREICTARGVAVVTAGVRLE